MGAARPLVLVLLVVLAGCLRSGPENGPPEPTVTPTDEPDLGPRHFHHAPEIERSIDGLPSSTPQTEQRLADGDRWELTMAPVAHDPGLGHPIRMWAFNGQVPGPILRIDQGSAITVDVHNGLPMPTTVHWHGLRLAAKDDGVPGLSQRAIEPGASFRYTLAFPDEGAFWYHPHVREDIQQELGLAGMIVVDGPRKASEAWPTEHVVVLDDLLVHGGDLVPFLTEGADRVFMGRYGNHLMVNGGLAPTLEAAPGERVRLILFDVANARPYSIAFDDAAGVELIGADGAYYPRPLPLNRSLIIGPAERYTVDIIMPAEGNVRLVNRIPEGEDELVRIDARGEPVEDQGAPAGPHERAAADLVPVREHLADPVSVEWDLAIRVLDASWGQRTGVIRSDFRHARHDLEPEKWPPGIAWTEFVPEINTNATTDRIEWVIRDARTLKEGDALDHEFELGSYVTIRIRNPAVGPNHMQHPIHIHGQRFVVARMDGAETPPLVWRDTVLIPTDVTAIITLELSNPGDWMFHCHISEHMEAGMMGVFTVR